MNLTGAEIAKKAHPLKSNGLSFSQMERWFYKNKFRSTRGNRIKASTIASCTSKFKKVKAISVKKNKITYNYDAAFRDYTKATLNLNITDSTKVRLLKDAFFLSDGEG